MRKIYEIMIVTAAIRHRFSTSQKIRFFSESAPFQLRDKSAFPPSSIFPILQCTLKMKEKSEEQSYKL